MSQKYKYQNHGSIKQVETSSGFKMSMKTWSVQKCLQIWRVEGEVSLGASVVSLSLSLSLWFIYKVSARRNWTKIFEPTSFKGLTFESTQSSGRHSTLHADFCRSIWDTTRKTPTSPGWAEWGHYPSIINKTKCILVTSQIEASRQSKTQTFICSPPQCETHRLNEDVCY